MLALALLTARGATQQDPFQLHQRSLTAVQSDGPTIVSCGDLQLDSGSTTTTTWTAAHSPYILPLNTTNDPTQPSSACPAFPLPGQPTNPTAGVVVEAGRNLVIDASLGPVQIFSHGAGISVNGGSLTTTGTGPQNFISFDAEPDVASWDGIQILASHGALGNASLGYTSIGHALTSITITSGATSTIDPSGKLDAHGNPAVMPYGLALFKSAIGPSYFDGIDVTDTPISVIGEPNVSNSPPLADGLFGTVNNIGSQGIKLTYDGSAPAGSAGVDIEATAFGSSVPFGDTTCLPLTPCAAGTIANDAIQARFAASPTIPFTLKHNRFYRAGNFGVELVGANDPLIASNLFDCNGSGTPNPAVTSCAGGGLKYSAVYLNGATVDLENRVTGNTGGENGLDAIVFNGTVTSSPTFTWKNATNSLDPTRGLGYLINGGMTMNGGTFKVPGSSVVKVKDGSITLNNATLDASDSGAKLFTSLRDNANITSCPTVFVQSCPNPLPAGEWSGIDVVGPPTSATPNTAVATINNATIRYPTTGVMAQGAHAIAITSSSIGPTFADGITGTNTPILVSGTTFGCPAGVCTAAAIGHQGINADYTTSGGTLAGALTATGNAFQSSVGEAIVGTGLAGQPVDIETNTINNAGSFGINLQGADHLKLQNNAINTSGTAAPTHSAIYLNGVSNADFGSLISGNTGTGNGLNAMVFHGSTSTPLAWQTVGLPSLSSPDPLGYMLDGDLTINGGLTLTAADPAGDYVPVLNGKITVTGVLAGSNATFTSFKEHSRIPTCGSVFVPKVSGACQAVAAGDWSGLVLTPSQANSLTGGEIRFAKTGITVGAPSSALGNESLTLSGTSIRNTVSDGVHSESPISVTGGSFVNNGGSAIDVDLSSGGVIALQPFSVTNATVAGSGADGILGLHLTGEPVQVSGVTIDHSGGFGIDLKSVDTLTGLTGNTVTNSAKNFAAIYLDGYNGDFAHQVAGNTGARNGLDALVFHGTVSSDLTWQTARNSNDPSRPLGYLLDSSLSMQPGKTLTVNAGDVVKVGNGGTLLLQGVTLRADNTSTSAQKIFTSLADNTAGVVACPSQLLPTCTAPAPGDWGGINLNGSTASGTLVNAAIRYAGTGIAITDGAANSPTSSSFGLVVSRSSISSSQADAIDALNTSLSVTDSSITGAVRGVSATITGRSVTAYLRLSGNRFMSTSAEAILGQALSGQPVWITDNHIQSAGTFGIRLLSPNALVLRNNNISASGGGPGAGAGRYPAIYLNAVTGDFVNNIRGNVGSGNGLDAIAMDGIATGNLAWITPRDSTTTHHLGYLLDGGLTLTGGTMTVAAGDVVKSQGGPITIKGGSVQVAGTSTSFSVFTSLKDDPTAPANPVEQLDANAVSCPSILATICSPGPGDWGGLAITSDAAGIQGSGSIAYGWINYANTAISIDSGPVTSAAPNLTVSRSTIRNTSKDGINALDSPIDIESTTIGDPSALAPNIAGHGIIASFLSPANCPPSCVRLTANDNFIYWTGQDGIVANGLGGQPTVVDRNTLDHAGTYGIRLVGADQLELDNNAIANSGGPTSSFRYPAIYLNGVKADFELASAANTVAGNNGSANGINAIVVHGEAIKPVTWLTPSSSVGPFGYMLDGPFKVDGLLTTNPGDNVKALAGGITASSLNASGTTFTSMRDGTVPVNACGSGFDSVFIRRISGVCPAPASGDWTGLTVTGPAVLSTTTIAYDDGLTVAAGGLTFNGGTMHDIAKNALVVNGSTLTVTGVTFYGIGADAIDGANASSDVITDDTFDHVTGAAINLKNAIGDIERNTFTNDATPSIMSSGAPVDVQCSSIQAGGLSGDGLLTANENDLGSGVTVTAPTGANLENNWWGQSSGPNTTSNQLSGGATVTDYLTSQSPTATIVVTGVPSTSQPLDPVNANKSLGTGLVQATISFSRKMNTDPAEPSVNYATSPVTLTGSWTNAKLWTGSAPINSLVAVNGAHTVSASGARDCVPDLAHNQMATTNQGFTADLTGLPIVTVNSADLIGAGSARLNAVINPNGWATNSAQSGTFVLTNVAKPTEVHTYATPAVADKTTPLNFSIVATGLNANTTYSYVLDVPSVNGVATESTLDSLTTTYPASQLAFSTSPPSSVQAAASFSAGVTAEDKTNAVVSDFAGTATIGLTLPHGSATLSGTLSQSFVNGVASFAGLTVDKTGSYTFTASSSPALTTPSSSSFTVTPGAATQLAFTTQPGNSTGGTLLSTEPQVSVEDAEGNTVTGDSSTQVSLALTSAGGATLSGTKTETAAAGVASFSDLSVDKTGSYTLTATSSPALTPGTSNSFTVAVGPASQLTFSKEPSSTTTASVAFTQQPAVSIEDAGGNLVNDSTTQVSVVLTNAGGATLSGTTTETASTGVATFTNLSVDKTGSYTLTASSSPALTTAISSSFTIKPGTATQLVFTTEPGNSTGGSALSPQPQVTVEDAQGNTVTGDNSTQVSVVLTTAGGATLSGTTTETASSGVATFTNLTVDKIGSYTLTASSSPALTTPTSTSFTVTVGAANQLAFSTQPSPTTTAATTFAQQPVVEVEDAGGNLVNDNSTQVSVALTSAGGATLSGTKTQTASSGVAAFTDLSVDKTGTYTLTASSTPALVTGISTSFTIQPGAATQLAFTVQPGDTNSTSPITPAVEVAVQDAEGNTVTGDSTTQVSVALTSAGGATLSGTTTETASSGVATFSNLGVDKTGSYTLTASSSPVLTTATSSSFTIKPGTATQLVFTTEPGSSTGGSALSPQPQVTVEDAQGNTVTGDSSTQVSVALTSAGGATLSGTKMLTASGGVATFTNLSVDKIGSYTLTAGSSPALTTPTSTSFTITVGAASQLAFSTQPSSTATAGGAFAQQPMVDVEDAGGNLVNDNSTQVSVALTSAGGATLSGTKTQTASAGHATFTGLSVDRTGTYTLTASSSPTLVTGISTSFTIQPGAATQLVFTTQPGNSTGGSVLSAQPLVTVEDAQGNTVTGDNSTQITVALTSAGGATLSGTTMETASSGVASFTNLSVDKIGSYTLTASSSPALSTPISNSFTVTVGPATHLAFTTEPDAAASANTPFTTQPVVSVEDAGGNVVTTDNSTSVSLSVAGGDGTGSVSCAANPVTVSTGAATFAGCQISPSSTTPYQLGATSTGLTGATSSDITVS